MRTDLPWAARRGGRTIMVPLASLLRPWLTASSSSDSESSTRLHHSSYLVILLILSSILSGPTFPIVVFSRNLSKRFSHRGFPSRVPIDRGRVNAPVIGSFHTALDFQALHLVRGYECGSFRLLPFPYQIWFVHR
jgi:hypothetical protein